MHALLLAVRDPKHVPGRLPNPSSAARPAATLMKWKIATLLLVPSTASWLNGTHGTIVRNPAIQVLKQEQGPSPMPDLVASRVRHLPTLSLATLTSVLWTALRVIGPSTCGPLLAVYLAVLEVSPRPALRPSQFMGVSHAAPLVKLLRATTVHALFTVKKMPGVHGVPARTLAVLVLASAIVTSRPILLTARLANCQTLTAIPRLRRPSPLTNVAISVTSKRATSTIVLRIVELANGRSGQVARFRAPPPYRLAPSLALVSCPVLHTVAKFVPIPWNPLNATPSFALWIAPKVSGRTGLNAARPVEVLALRSVPGLLLVQRSVAVPVPKTASDFPGPAASRSASRAAMRSRVLWIAKSASGVITLSAPTVAQTKRVPELKLALVPLLCTMPAVEKHVHS